MKQQITSIYKLAEHLIAFESESANSEEASLPAEPVCNKLRPHLATLMGITGFRSLLARALARATIKVPVLHILQVSADGALECLPAASQDRLAQSGEGSVTLIAELLNLLCAFIGVNLTLQLVGDIWPEAPINEVNFVTGERE